MVVHRSIVVVKVSNSHLLECMRSVLLRVCARARTIYGNMARTDADMY